MQVLTHNLVAQFTNRQLNITTDKKTKSSEKLSSGYKINKSADDAAGLQISEKMRSQIRGLNQASDNIQDGISLCQVADGALNESHAVLQRMRELSIQAANDTNSDEDRNAIQQEINQLTQEIDRIANDTNFNEAIYPLLGQNSGNNSISNGNSGTGNIAGTINELLDSNYPGNNVQYIDNTNLNTFPSYTDSEGKFHYTLGAGTFSISSISNVVLDVSGNTCIENTSLSNVTLECDSGTHLSIKNVLIDNSQNVSKDIATSNSEIGAAIKFNGTNNSLDYYGANTILGGADNYTDYVSSTGTIYRKACAAIDIEKNVSVQFNGTNNSTLHVQGSTTDSIGGRLDAFDTSSAAIGTESSDFSGNITFNSGHIVIDNGIGIIGDTIVVNGGKFDISSDNIALGSFTTGRIEINNGIINAQSNTNLGQPTIGHLKGGVININNGTIRATNNSSRPLGGAAIGGSEAVGIINITGGDIYAETNLPFSSAIGSSVGANGGIINISGGKIKAISSDKVDAVGDGLNPKSESQSYVDGVLTDTTGTDDGNGHHIYSYPNDSTSNGNGNQSGNSTSSSGINNDNLWIQMGAQKDQGMFLNLVDATAKGVGITDPALDVTNYTNASTSISRLDSAISKVSSYRSSFGSQQNRLEQGKLVDDNTAENTQNAESRIRDTDMAAEIVEHSKNSILEQAGQAILAQANQNTQNILSLLR